MNIKAYKKYIYNLAEKASNEVFLNSSSEHAACVMSNIFRKSQRSVNILAGDLNGGISNNQDYITELKRFLDRNGRVRILLNSYKEGSYPTIFYLLNDYIDTDQVEVKVTNEKLLLRSKEVHFTLGDESMIRIEHDIKKYLAYGNFNFSSADMWLSKFNEMYNKSDKALDLSIN